jgi:hypothetical protein
LSKAARPLIKNFLSLKRGVKSFAPLTFRSRHPLIKAEIQISYDAAKELRSQGVLEIKIPFKDKMRFEFASEDLFEHKLSLKNFQFSDQGKYFGRWWTQGGQIFYKDHRKEATFAAADVPLMSAAALLFCVLQERSAEFSVVYIGAGKLYQIDFERSSDGRSLHVYQSPYQDMSNPEVRKLGANLFLKSDFSIQGGELFLPILGKINFDLSSAASHA